LKYGWYIDVKDVRKLILEPHIKASNCGTLDIRQT
jgi:hypothetical protein